MKFPPASARLVLRSAALFLSLVAIGAALHYSGLASALDQKWIDAAVRGQGLRGETLFVAAGAAFIALGLPRQVIAFLAGYAFGLAMGSALALLAAVLGCIAAFAYARLLGRELVAARFPARVRRIDDFLAENPLAMTLLIRFLPLGSNMLTNLAAGVSRVPPTPFIAGSALGYVPQTVVFALIGSGVAVDLVFRVGLGAALFAASGALGVYLYRRHHGAKTLGEDIERDLDTRACAARDAHDSDPPAGGR
ncbi:MAG: TVP38/TMEM64 family protein [Rhodospirillales bacterium]|nr:TVP38/TMEM64 family protein [Rhodospirillales bacterium]